MIPALRRRREEEHGFTLIELMVVILIIAILMAIAIPTYLNARSSADNTAAQSDLRNALTAEQAQYSNGGQSYVAATALSSEGNLSFVSASGNASANTVAVYPFSASNNAVCLSTQSKSGNWYGLIAVGQSVSGGLQAGDYYATVQAGSAATDPCSTLPTSLPTTTWSTTAW